MFLDEELESIYNEYPDNTTKRLTLLLQACQRRNPVRNQHINASNVTIFINYLKRTDASWRLFCQKHTDCDPNTFKEFVLFNYPNKDVLEERIWGTKKR